MCVALSFVLFLPLSSTLPAEEDEQTLLPLDHLQPSQLPACPVAIADSRKHIDSIASQLGVENKLSDRWESQLLFRQSQGIQASNGREVSIAPTTPATQPPRLEHTFAPRPRFCTIACAARLLHPAQVGAQHHP